MVLAFSYNKKSSVIILSLKHNEYKKVKKRNLNIKKLQVIIESLLGEKRLDAKYKNHELSGNWHGYRECHIEPDWLLIYKIDGKILKLVRTGSHSDLF